MLGIYLYDKHNIKEVLAKWAIWKFRNDIKYNNKKMDIPETDIHLTHTKQYYAL
jgi:hypothetical protein